jgi:outer membrane protein TolC
MMEPNLDHLPGGWFSALITLLLAIGGGIKWLTANLRQERDDAVKARAEAEAKESTLEDELTAAKVQLTRLEAASESARIERQRADTLLQRAEAAEGANASLRLRIAQLEADVAHERGQYTDFAQLRDEKKP